MCPNIENIIPISPPQHGYMYVCMYVCTCMYVCMYIYIYASGKGHLKIGLRVL